MYVYINIILEVTLMDHQNRLDTNHVHYNQHKELDYRILVLEKVYYNFVDIPPMKRLEFVLLVKVLKMDPEMMLCPIQK